MPRSVRTTSTSLHSSFVCASAAGVEGDGCRCDCSPSSPSSRSSPFFLFCLFLLRLSVLEDLDPVAPSPVTGTCNLSGVAGVGVVGRLSKTRPSRRSASRRLAQFGACVRSAAPTPSISTSDASLSTGSVACARRSATRDGLSSRYPRIEYTPSANPERKVTIDVPKITADWLVVDGGGGVDMVWVAGEVVVGVCPRDV